MSAHHPFFHIRAFKLISPFQILQVHLMWPVIFYQSWSLARLLEHIPQITQSIQDVLIAIPFLVKTGGKNSGLDLYFWLRRHYFKNNIIHKPRKHAETLRPCEYLLSPSISLNNKNSDLTALLYSPNSLEISNNIQDKTNIPHVCGFCGSLPGSQAQFTGL